MSMARPEDSSIAWFAMFMRLNNTGIVPTVTPTEYMPTREQLANFFGPKCNSGYVFDNHGSAEYEEYTRELFVRVWQTPWPINHVLPFHFARGLLAEAMGDEVNWAEFGFKMTHPHQSRSRIPRILEEYEELENPLPPLFKVAPDLSLGDQSGLTTPHPRPDPINPEETNGTRTNSPAVPNEVEREARPAAATPRSAPARPPHFKYATGTEMKVNFEVGGSSTPRIPIPSNPDAINAEFPVRILIPSLSVLRPGIIPLVEAEQRKLQESRHLAYSTVSKQKGRLREEKERAKQFARRVAEKETAYERAVAEYESSRRVAAAAMGDVVPAAGNPEKARVNNMIRCGEALMNIRYKNVQTARNQLAEWRLKSERHSVFIARVHAELMAAETEYSKTCTLLDADLAHLLTLTNLLDQVKG